MSQLKAGDFEYLQTTCGFTKCLDFTKDEVQLGNQTFKSVYDTLQTVMSFCKEAMQAAFTDKEIAKFGSFDEFLDKKFPDYRPQHLDPVYICMDSYFFATLQKSKNANFSFDIKSLYYSK